MLIEELLSEIPGLTVFHSYGNYILFDGKATGKKGKEMVEYAQSRGMISRPQGEMYDSNGWFRITIGSEEENQMGVDLIRDFTGINPRGDQIDGSDQGRLFRSRRRDHRASAAACSHPWARPCCWAFPPAERARAAALLAIPTAVAPASGPRPGGYLVEYQSWDVDLLDQHPRRPRRPAGGRAIPARGEAANPGPVWTSRALCSRPPASPP